MKLSRILIAASIIIALPRIAYSQEICTGLLDKASIDESDTNFDIELANSLYRNSCSGSSSSRSFSAETGMSAIVNAIPFKGTGNFGSKKETLNNFCKTFKQSKYFRNETRLRNRTVVREALVAFNRCIEFSNKSLFVSPKIAKTQVAVDVRRGSEPAKLLKVQIDETKLSCFVKGANGKQQNAAKFEVIDLNSTFSTSIICDRIAEKMDDGSIVYARADMTIGTDRGSFQFTIPEERKLTSKWASDFGASLQGLQTQILNSNNKVTANNKNIAILNGAVKYIFAPGGKCPSGWKHLAQLGLWVNNADKQAAKNAYFDVGAANQHVPYSWIHPVICKK